MKGRATVALAGAAVACVAWFVVYRRRRQETEPEWDFADISREQAEARTAGLSTVASFAGAGQELQEMEAEDRLMEAIVTPQSQYTMRGR